MKWKKMGNIFDPRDYELPNNCVEFAQSPQSLVFKDFVRIYFSTREMDSSKKYLSHICFADFDRKFNLLRISKNPVLGLGELGCYDEHGIFPLNVLKHKDILFGYIGGWSRRVSVSVDGAIGLATSFDQGETFHRLGKGPVLTASLNEPFLVGDPFTLVVDDIFHMWYIFGKKWEKFDLNSYFDRVYKIGHAISLDGVTWEKTNEGEQTISDKLNIDESQALPTVIKINDRFHMFFCYRHSSDFRQKKERGYRIGHAYSRDLSHWERDDEDMKLNVSDDGWDSDMLCYPHVFEMDGDIYLLYNGNEFGKYGFGMAILEA
jgi:hypothetical protein